MSVVGKKGSGIFSGFRALGLYSSHLPHVVRFHKKHREFYVVTAVGQCFHTYNVSQRNNNNNNNKKIKPLVLKYCLYSKYLNSIERCSGLLTGFIR